MAWRGNDGQSTSWRRERVLYFSGLLAAAFYLDFIFCEIRGFHCGKRRCTFVDFGGSLVILNKHGNRFSTHIWKCRSYPCFYLVDVNASVFIAPSFLSLQIFVRPDGYIVIVLTVLLCQTVIIYRYNGCSSVGFRVRRQEWGCAGQRRPFTGGVSRANQTGHRLVRPRSDDEEHATGVLRK